jgi:hypothetical protein
MTNDETPNMFTIYLNIVLEAMLIPMPSRRVMPTFLCLANAGVAS